MNSIGRYRDERGLTDEQVAGELSALLGRRIGAQGVKLHSAKAKAPKAWAEALGLTDDEPEPFAADSSDGGLPRQGMEDTPSVRESEPPTPPPGAKTYLPATTNTVAQERIATAYGLIGAGASQLTRNDGVEVVFDVYAPHLAEAWVQAAQENKFAARVVALASAGGPMGDLVMAHVILVIGLLYVSGIAPEIVAQGLGSNALKFGPYRDAATSERRAAAQGDPDLNGSGAEGAASFVEHDPL